MYNQELCEQKAPYNPSPLERLKNRKARLEHDLKKIDEAINTLEGNPEMAKVVEALQIAHY